MNKARTLTTGRGTSAAAGPRRRAGRRPEVTREDWIEAGLAELGRRGPGAVRLESLCARLNITKGSFYWYFSGREEFMQKLLETWEARDTLALIDYVEKAGGAPVEKLFGLFRAANSGRVDFRVEQAIRHWGHSDAGIRVMLHAVDRKRTAYLETLFGQLTRDAGRAEAQARLFYSLILGEAMIYRRETRSERLARQAEVFWAILGMTDLSAADLGAARAVLTSPETVSPLPG